MESKKIYLSQDPENVYRIMNEEDCEQCFNCPIATLIGSKICYMSDVQLALSIDVKEIDLELNLLINDKIIEEKTNLRHITSDCRGMNNIEEHTASFWRRPPTMCKSERYIYSPIDQVAGRLSYIMLKNKSNT